jgi:hypothetical protein
MSAAVRRVCILCDRPRRRTWVVAFPSGAGVFGVSVCATCMRELGNLGQANRHPGYWELGRDVCEFVDGQLERDKARYLFRREEVQL